LFSNTRFQAFNKLADQIIDVMKVGMTKGLTNHAVSMESTVKQCDDHVNKATRYKYGIATIPRQSN
jgi:hypothetical protein